MDTVEVTINGATRDVPSGLTIASLLSHLEVTHSAVAVERNGAVVPRSEHGAISVIANDRLEIVSFVGGG